jgi:hypothetical protein
MNRKNYRSGFAIAVLVACSLYLSSLIATPVVHPAAELVPGLSVERYSSHLNFLARPEMKGRGNGTPELEWAADYLASQFQAAGLQPAGEDGTFFQPFDLTTGAEFGSRNELQVDGAVLRLNQDFVPISFSGTGEVEGPVVFAGYGITAPELHYDDYQGIDAKGKVVVVFRHEPQELDQNSVFNGANFTTHATFINKAINARQHGASGIVFITDPNAHPNEPDAVGAATRGAETDNVGISSVHALRAPIAAMFQKTGKDLAAVQTRIDASLQPESFEFPARIRIATDVVRARKTVRNVVAALIGSDPVLKDEWVVIGAHYDHLGLGDRNSLAPSLVGQVHHGADDNASGASGVLELARLANLNRQEFKRSVLFMGFAGEELGLLGSSHFVNHPTIPLDKITAMMNLDMIGRVSNNRLFLGGVGSSPGFRSSIEQLNESVGLSLDYSESVSAGSDHASFNAKRIPILFFFAGLHADYHKPSDTPEKINSDGALKIVSLVYLMANRLASETERPQFTQVQAPRQSGGGGGYGPWFGSIPDFRDDVKGVLFADVTPNSPAAKGGLKPGDTLIEFDGKSIETLYDFTYALGQRKAGDVVAVVVRRGSEDIKVNITLEARR